MSITTNRVINPFILILKTSKHWKTLKQMGILEQNGLTLK